MSSLPSTPSGPADSSMDSWGGETDWNLIRAAGDGPAGAERERAWKRLMERYHAPVHRTLRRCLRDDPAAEDAAADFFGDLFQKQILRKADPGQGRFRCYIQGVARRFALQWRRARAPSRASDVDEVDVEGREDATVERAEETAWAEAVLDHAFASLRSHSPRDAEILARSYGIGGYARVESAELSRQLGINSNALDVARHRARARLAGALLDELRPMVASSAELNAEREWLVARLLEAHPGLLG